MSELKITEKEKNKLFDECIDLLKELDEKLFGLKVIINYY